MILKLYRSVAARFRSFDNKEMMNEHVNVHIYAAGRKLHKNARAVLNMIANHSVKYGGVSWLNDETIAKALDIHVDTVKRAYKRFIELGIGRHESVEVSGIILRYFIINRFEIADNLHDDEDDVSLTETSVEPTLDDARSIKKLEETVDNKSYSKDVSGDLDSSYTPSNVPQEFIDTAAPFYRSASDIYALWNRVRIAYNDCRLSAPVDAVMDTVIKAFKQAIFLFKAGRVRDFGGYFFGTLRGMLAVRKREETIDTAMLERIYGEG